jgi:hypothetical protein
MDDPTLTAKEKESAAAMRIARGKGVTVFRFANGMVAVCDVSGEQMPEYQGRYGEKVKSILRDLPLAKWEEQD